MRHFSIWIALLTANFAYQFITAENWLTAFERSYFQGFAILVCFLIARPGKNILGEK